MTALPHSTYMSVEEYQQLSQKQPDLRYEYIDGDVRMLAGGSLNHATISFNIARLLYEKLQSGPCRVYTSDAQVRLFETCYVYPDVTVSCSIQDQGETDVIKSPSLIVEVLSPSTEAYDRGQKFALYRECSSIQEYMLISSQQINVEIFKREKNDLWIYRAYGRTDTITLTNLNISLPVDAIYDHVNFTGNRHF